MIKRYINRLRMGLEEDRYGWMHSCENSGVWELVGSTEHVGA